MTSDNPAEPVSRGAPRIIRRVTPPDSPWAGALARTDDGQSCQLVDAAELDGWAGWSALPGGHLLAPLDVIRRPDGHDVVFPYCPERLDVFLVRRRRGELPLSDGEATTVAVSLIRGLSEAYRHLRGSIFGQWWITDAGCPILRLGGDTAAGVDASRVLTSLSTGRPPALATAIGRTAASVEDGRRLARRVTIWKTHCSRHRTPHRW